MNASSECAQCCTWVMYEYPTGPGGTAFYCDNHVRLRCFNNTGDTSNSKHTKKTNTRQKYLDLSKSKVLQASRDLPI